MPVKNVPVTLRLPEELYLFLDAYSTEYSVPKRAILENSVLEKIGALLKEKKMELLKVEGFDLEALKKEVSNDEVREKTFGREKLVIFVNPSIHKAVNRICVALLIKPTDFYRICLTEFFWKNKDKVSMKKYKTPDLLKEIERFLYGDEGKLREN